MNENKRLIFSADTSQLQKAKSEATALLQDIRTQRQQADASGERGARRLTDAEKEFNKVLREQLALSKEQLAIREREAQSRIRERYLSDVTSARGMGDMRNAQLAFERRMLSSDELFRREGRRLDRFGGLAGGNPTVADPSRSGGMGGYLGSMSAAQYGMYGQMVGAPIRQGLVSLGGATDAYSAYAQIHGIKGQAVASAIGMGSTAIGSGLMMSGNPIAMVAGGVISAVGNVFAQIYGGLSEAESQIMSRAFQASAQYSQSSRGIAQQLGGGIGGAKRLGSANRGFYRSLGLSMTEGVQQQSQFMSAFLDPFTANRGSMELMRLNANYANMDLSNMQSFLSSTGGGSAGSVAQNVYGSLLGMYRAQGYSMQEARALARKRVGVDMQNVNALTQQIYAGSGVADTGMATGLYNFIGGGGVAPTRALGIAQGLAGGLGDNPLSRITSIEVARKLRPDWTARELSQANDLLKNDSRYIRGSLSAILGQSGGNLATFQTLLGGYFKDLTPKDEQYISRAIFGVNAEGNRDDALKQRWMNFINKGQGADWEKLKVELPSQNFVDPVTGSRIDIENKMTDVGERLVPAISKNVESIEKKINTIVDKMLEEAENKKREAERREDFQKKLEAYVAANNMSYTPNQSAGAFAVAAMFMSN